MIHAESFAVTTENGPRPAGPPDRCFYCDEAVGGVHKSDCVLRERTIVARLVIEHVVVVPEHWTPEHFLFHRNEGTWCASNVLRELGASDGDGPCICHATEVAFVREATDEDEERLWFDKPGSSTTAPSPEGDAARLEVGEDAPTIPEFVRIARNAADQINSTTRAHYDEVQMMLSAVESIAARCGAGSVETAQGRLLFYEGFVMGWLSRNVVTSAKPLNVDFATHAADEYLREHPEIPQSYAARQQPVPPPKEADNEPL